MTAFSIGEPMPPERLEKLLCGLISTMPDQRGEKCGATADLHVLVKHPEHGTFHALLTCAYHYEAAVQSGERVETHEIGLWCGLPAARFDAERNVCVLDDSGIEPGRDKEGGRL